jgi:hypothetical protein
MDVTAHSSVEAFFHEVLSDAFGRRQVEVRELTESYLVGLLGEFTRSQISDEPLGLKWLESRHGSPGERVRALKEVGDTTLYVAGFFAESLERKLVDTEYYIGLGEAAYGELAQRMGGSSLCQIYEELSEGFPGFVDVLTEVRGAVDMGSDDVASLYHQWLRTRAEWIERRLRRLGVVMPTPHDNAAGKGYWQ